MPALTKARRLALGTVLEVPYSLTHKEVSEDGLTVSDKTVSASISANSAIDAYLTASIYTDADVQTALETALDEWTALGTGTMRIEGGSVGGITGIYDNPAEQRSEIARRIIHIVPFYRHHLQLLRSNDCNIPILR
jgi:hypothetical protein